MEHFVQWFREGRISVADFDGLRDWLNTNPDVQDREWFKRFPKFTLAGEGELPKTFLTQEGRTPDRCALAAAPVHWTFLELPHLLAASRARLMMCISGSAH